MRTLSAFACVAILAIALMLTVLLTGCSQKEEVPADTGAAPANPSGAKAAGAGGGAAADMTPIPAPTGVKTGLEGGRKGP